MAGIYIPGMEMPKSSGKYRIEFDSCGNPYLLSDSGDLGLWHLVPVPPHGRLIDADALVDSFDPSDFWNPDAEDNCFAAIHVVNCAPTIIPVSEEGEA